MHRLLLWLHNWIGNFLECVPDEGCDCFDEGYNEAVDTVAEWFTPPERD